MKTEPIESNPSQAPSASTAQPPIDPPPPSFDRMLSQLEAAVQASTAKPGDPAFGTTIDRQLLLQSGVTISQLRYTLDKSPKLSDAIYASLFNTLNRATALLERTRSRIHRGETASARIALRTLELQNKEQRAKPERDQATEFLLAELAEGERPAKEIIKSARELGISPRTLNRAKADMNIRCRLHHENKQRTWQWSLPASELKQVAANPSHTSSPESPDSPSFALVPSASAGGEDHLLQAITNDAPSLDPTTPNGPIAPIGPISSSPHPQPAPHEILRLPPVMATSENPAGNLSHSAP